LPFSLFVFHLLIIVLKTKNKYSLIIIGAGPSGLTASIYASRYKIDHLIIGQAIGGLAFDAHKICNFPTEQEISGAELTKKMKEHAEFLGGTSIMDKVIDVRRENDKLFKITTQGEKIFWAKALLLAIGTKYRKMDLPDEDKFLGKGISYCATCDAMFYKDKTVAVIGGSDSANTASLYLSQIANKVYQIYRRNKLRGETAWIEQVLASKKIEVIYNATVTALKGEEKLEKIVLSTLGQNKKELAVDGLFIEIGSVPDALLTKQLNLDIDKNGFIKVSPEQKTSQIGVWAAGDITNASNYFRQIITACAEGAIAAENIYKFLQKA